MACITIATVINHLKTIFFLIVCLAVGVGIGKAYVWMRQPPTKRGFEHSEGPPVVTGMGDAPAQRGFAMPPDRLPTAAMFTQWQGNFATTVGIPCTAALTEKALADTVSLAHAHQIRVVLLPPNLGAGSGSAKAPFPDGSLARAAALAQSANVDYLCVSDLDREPDMNYWRSALADARAAFKGQIILAARPDAMFRINCWDLADIIGVVGPLPIPQRLPTAPADVSLHDLRVAWDCTLTSLESLATVHNKKLALLNMSVPLEVATRLSSPGGGAANVKPARNPNLQRMIYEALLLETKGRAEKTTMLLLTWGDSGGGQADAPNNVPGLLATIRDDWDPQKPLPVETAPAEEVPADENDAAWGQENADNGN
jgi:hypothetical protein